MNDEPEIDLTPLIDVVFVVLVVFIIIAPLLDVEKVALAPAKPIKDQKTLEVKEKSSIAIVVRSDNSMTINGEGVQIDHLSAHLKQLKEQFPGAIPQLFHDQKAHFGTYQQIKCAAQVAGFNELDLILKPE